MIRGALKTVLGKVIDPITVRRFKRFREMKRAWWSFVLLSLIFVLSLFSELWANPRPFVIRAGDHLAFPALQHAFGRPPLTEDDVYGNGVGAELDYRTYLRENPDAFAIRAAVTYGPKSTLAPDDIDVPESVQLRIERAQMVLSVDVDEELKIVRTAGDVELLGGDAGDDASSLRGRSVGEFFPVSDRLESALSSRFANQSAPEFSEQVGETADLYLTEYEERSRPRRRIRFTLRERAGKSALWSGPISETAPHLPPEGRVWVEKLPQETIDALQKSFVEVRAAPVPPVIAVVDGKQLQFILEYRSISFPFGPVKGHRLGLDEGGRDVWVLLLYATRISLLFGFALVLLTIALGVVIGGLQGYFGGMVDLLGQRVIEVWASLPFLYIMILLGSLLGRSFGLLLVVYALFSWIGISMYMRAEFLKLRKQPFVESARVLGLRPSRIMWRHILPNALVPIITFFPFMLVGAIGSLSALDFLGFGLPPGTASWGDLLRQFQTNRHAWWLVLYPSLALFTVVLLGVFIGEGLRAAFDPKKNVEWEA